MNISSFGMWSTLDTLPHGDLGPQSFEAERELPVVFGNVIFGEAEVGLKPRKEARLEDLARAVKGIASEPDQFRFAKAEPLKVIHLSDERAGIDLVRQAHVGGPIDHFAGDLHGGKVLPDELQHQQFVEIGIQQRPHDGVKLPVVVVGPLREVHIHIQTFSLRTEFGMPVEAGRQDEAIAWKAK